MVCSNHFEKQLVSSIEIDEQADSRIEHNTFMDHPAAALLTSSQATPQMRENIFENCRVAIISYRESRGTGEKPLQQEYAGWGSPR
ncbi:MAG: hypothetical protein KatS3mg114_0412 [Planctomycetaceae bacterium]|nr:MAG: hypothetical protein KatS3mg114_0412 [Planctomycetaceae bacterium]